MYHLTVQLLSHNVTLSFTPFSKMYIPLEFRKEIASTLFTTAHAQVQDDLYTATVHGTLMLESAEPHL